MISIGHLPLPVLGFLIIISVVGILVYVKKSWNKESKFFLIGMALLALGGLVTFVEKLSPEFFRSNSLDINLANSILFGMSIFLISIGAFKKVKLDPHKRKMLLTIWVTAGTAIALLWLVVLWASTP